MQPTRQLHDLGQSLWLDNITRELITTGTLARYIDELSVTGLTSNPTIFHQAIKGSSAYDASIRAKLARGQVGRGAVLRAGAGGPEAGGRPVPAGPRAHGRRRRLGLARSLAAPRLRHARPRSPKRASSMRGPGGAICSSRSRERRKGVPAIEEAIFAGVPINVTLLFSARAVPRVGGGLSARHRAAHRGGIESGRAVGGVDLREPLGRRGGRQGARGAHQPARHRRRAAERTRLIASFWRRRVSSGR